MALLRALVVEDSEEDYLLLLRELGRQGFETRARRAETADAMRMELDRESWDIVFADHRLPTLDAPSALKLLQESGKDLPFLVISGTIGEEAAVAAMKAGAHDYLMKGSLGRLGEAVRREIQAAATRRSRRLGLERIEHLNKVLRAIRSVSQLIVKERDRGRLIQRASECLTESRGYHNVWIGVLGSGEELIAVGQSGAEPEQPRGPGGTARLPPCCEGILAQSEVRVTEGRAAACEMCSLTAVRDGRARMAVRISHGPSVFGVLCASLPAHLARLREERDLFREVAADLGLALQDISLAEERERTARDLAESRRQAATLMDNLPGMAYRCENEPEWTMEFVSGGCRVLTGYAPKDLIANASTSFGRLIHDDDRRRVWDSTQRALEREIPFRLVYRIRTAGGETRWVWEQGQGVYDEGGNVVAIEGFISNITERVKSEDALRHAESRMRSVFRAAPIGIGMVSGGIIQEGNDRFYGMTGYSADELVGRPWSLLYTSEEEGCAVWEEVFRRIELTGLGTVETRLRRKDGQILDIVLNASRLNPSDPAAGMTCTLLDISERKCAERDLAESEMKYRLLFEEADALISVYDEDGVCRLMNRRIAALFGGEPAAFVGKSVHELHPDVSEEYAQRIRACIDTGRSCEFEDEVAFPTGSRWLLSRIHPLKEPGAASRSAQILSTDITTRKLAEQELRERQAFLDTLLDTLPDPVFYKDTRGRYLGCNRAYETIFGRSREELIGKSVYDVSPRSLADQYHAKDLELLERGGLQEYGFKVKLPSGEVRDVIFRKATFPDASGKLGGLIGTIVDITELERVKRALEASEEQFRQAQKLEAVGRLAGGVAHDFNNLLSVIIGYGELVLHRLPAEDPLRGYVEQILGAGERSSRLTRQLLAFSRNQSLEPRVLDLNRIVENLQQLLARMIGEDLELRLELGGDVKRVRADAGQIEQVIMNLAVNARDAMSEGGRLTIKTANVEVESASAGRSGDLEPGEYVALEVTDEGTGMDQETLEHAFEPFFTTKERGKGTGLGLSTVYGIVKQTGGDVSACSEPGRGTTIKVHLPATDEPVGPEPDAGGDLELTGDGEHLLIVEDEDAIRSLIVEILSDFNLTVSTAASGAEALELVREGGFEPELLITDVVMPGMSGPDLVVRLRQLVPDLKVLFMSGYSEDAILRRGVVEEGAPLLQKPFSAGSFAAKIREVLSLTGTPAGASESGSAG